MKRLVLFWIVLILILIVLSVVVISSTKADALILEGCSLITPYDSATQTYGEMYALPEVRFLLTRKDMENAALAFETVTIREDQIKKLEAFIKQGKTKTVVAVIGSSALACLVGLIVGHFAK